MRTIPNCSSFKILHIFLKLYIQETFFLFYQLDQTDRGRSFSGPTAKRFRYNTLFNGIRHRA